MSAHKILFVVSNNPFSKDRKTILNLIKHLLELDTEIRVYLHGNGVWWLGLDDFKNLTSDRFKVYCSLQSVQKRHQHVPEWVEVLDSQRLADLIEDSHKVLFFN
jgi:sulfur relay (sulfurtransferase) DsrF/TusC family protein